MNKSRPEISRRSIPNLPWNFELQKESVCFVLGISNRSWPRKEKHLPKDWPVAYKTVRWHRLDILKENREEYRNDGKKHSIQNFINKSIASIKAEKAKGKLKSVHSIIIIYDPHGADEFSIEKV